MTYKLTDKEIEEKIAEYLCDVVCDNNWTEVCKSKPWRAVYISRARVIIKMARQEQATDIKWIKSLMKAGIFVKDEKKLDVVINKLLKDRPFTIKLEGSESKTINQQATAQEVIGEIDKAENDCFEKCIYGKRCSDNCVPFLSDDCKWWQQIKEKYTGVQG